MKEPDPEQAAAEKLESERLELLRKAASMPGVTESMEVFERALREIERAQGDFGPPGRVVTSTGSVG